MICRHKLYHFTVANTRFTAPLTRCGKTKFATIKWYNLCRQIIQSQTCYPLNKRKKYFQPTDPFFSACDSKHTYFLVHLSRRLKCTIVITRCPSSVRPSVVLPLVTFHIFDFSSETTEQNSTKLDRKQDPNVLYQVFVFRANRKNKMAALASDWLRHFRLLWNHWTEFNKTWQEARSQRPLPSLCFSGRSEKQDGRPGLWLVETFSTSPLKPLNGIQRNLTGSKILTSSTKFVFFGPIGKTRYNVAALASDWLRHFRLLLWNRLKEFNQAWQEARSHHPLPSSCFSGQSEKDNGRPGLWLPETFLTSPLKLLNGIQPNLTGGKILKSSTKFVFFGPIWKTRWPH